MSGDVQPRKRKDKRKKKDEINVDEPRGTAAALGEGDVFLHSQHDHGTGGHWCAKIIFFSLLAVLVTLIGLIILENRGLTELEANSVESRYSGVLDGWIEDAPDDHHDEQTLDLKHHEDDHLEDNVQEDSEVEVERIEREVSDEELQQELSSNEVNAPVQKSEEKIDGGKPEDEVEDSVEDDEDEFLEPEDIEESPVVEHITAPAGKPLPELEDDISTEKPINSLTEEDEYEKQQEQLRLEKEQASHMWLKVVVGAALLVATHAVVRRATASRGAY